MFRVGDRVLVLHKLSEDKLATVTTIAGDDMVWVAIDGENNKHRLFFNYDVQFLFRPTARWQEVGF
jgi:hypothetical protein